MASLERARIEEALRADGWNISRAAARLGLPRNTLRYRMERHGLTESGEGAPRRRSSEFAGHNQSRSASTAGAMAANARHAPPCAGARSRCDGSGARARTRDRRHRAKGQCVRWPDHRGGSRCVKAAFGLDLIEDAARHAAHAAFAVQRAVGASTPPLEVRIALHTEEMLVGRLEDRVELDADGRRAAQHVLDGMLAISPGQPILASATTKPFLERRFDVEPLTAAPEPRRVWRVIGLADADRACEPVRVAHAAKSPCSRICCCRSKEAMARRCSWPATRASARRACCTNSIAGPAVARPGCRDRPCPLAARCHFTRSSTCSNARSPFRPATPTR